MLTLKSPFFARSIFSSISWIWSSMQSTLSDRFSRSSGENFSLSHAWNEVGTNDIISWNRWLSRASFNFFLWFRHWIIFLIEALVCYTGKYVSIFSIKSSVYLLQPRVDITGSTSWILSMLKVAYQLLISHSQKRLWYQTCFHVWKFAGAGVKSILSCRMLVSFTTHYAKGHIQYDYSHHQAHMRGQHPIMPIPGRLVSWFMLINF